MQYSQDDLTRLISEVEQAFTGVLLSKSEQTSAAPKDTTLSKSEKEEKEEDKEEPKKEEKEEPKHEPKSEHSEEEPKSEEHEEPKAEEAEKEHEHEEEEHEKEEDEEHGHGYDDEDMEHMHKMYMSMNKGELRAHHDSVKSALDHHGMEKCESMTKSETITVKPELVKTTSEIAILKSELETEKSKSDELKKNLDAVTEILTKLAKKSAPKEKAITSMDFIAKSEIGTQEEKVLTKSDIHQILNQKAQEPTLSKSDREAINVYYNNGQTNINNIRHLLKSKA